MLLHDQMSELRHAYGMRSVGADLGQPQPRRAGVVRPDIIWGYADLPAATFNG